MSRRLTAIHCAAVQEQIPTTSTGETIPTVLVAEKLGEAGLKILEGVASCECSYGLTESELKEKVAHCDGLIIRSGTQVTREVFEASKGRLKVVGRAGVGVDNVDLTAATEAGCLVVNAPTANTVAAAEHGIALLCSMARNIPSADASMKEGKWLRTEHIGTSLVGKTLAVMGFGKVGSEVARRARGLGMEVIAHDPYASDEKARAIGVKLVHFKEALANADFFSLHMPLTPSTKKMFDKDTFMQMKPGARIVNVARGGVIDDEALIEALDEGIVAQAALDVFESEPPSPDHPLIKHPKARNLGGLVPTAVNAPMVPPEVLKELKPYIGLAEGLGKSAIQLVADTGFTDISLCYSSPRGDDLDTRLLRANVIKGLLEQVSESIVNMVNADLLAENRGLRISEITVKSEGKEVLSSMSISVKTSASRFSGALDKYNRLYLEGAVKYGMPHLTKLGSFDVDLSLEGSIMLVRQIDQPGIVAACATILSEAGVNVNFMTVCRRGNPGEEAIMAIGVDNEPDPIMLRKIPEVKGVMEFAMFKEI
eukprot:g4067.t1